MYLLVSMLVWVYILAFCTYSRRFRVDVNTNNFALLLFDFFDVDVLDVLFSLICSESGLTRGVVTTTTPLSRLSLTSFWWWKQVQLHKYLARSPVSIPLLLLLTHHLSIQFHGFHVFSSIMWLNQSVESNLPCDACPKYDADFFFFFFFWMTLWSYLEQD